MSSTATERPWVITTEFEGIVPFSIVKADDTGGAIADVFGDSMDEAEANASLIRNAVNAWDDMAALHARIRQLQGRADVPVRLAIDADGHVTGGIEFFCSTQCREIAPWTTDYRDDEQPLSELEDGTVCDNCGKIVTPSVEVMQLREFAEVQR